MIWAFTGKTGSGKTYLMVKQAFSEWKNGRNIYSNTVLNFEKYVKEKDRKHCGTIRYFEHLNEILETRNGLILFDEAQVLFNARNWESLPDEFQYKLQQHRKHQLDLYCTTQNMGTIDIAYRRLVQKWFHCENVWQIGRSPRIYFGNFLYREKDIDRLYNNVDDLVVPDVNTKHFRIYYFSRNLYDTMYDIGFKRFKIVWDLNSKYSKINQKIMIKQKLLIIPKKMSLDKASRVISSSNYRFRSKK